MRGFFFRNKLYGGIKRKKLKGDGLKRCYSKWSIEEHTSETFTDHFDLTVFLLTVVLHQRFLVLMSSSSSFAKAKGFSILQWMKNKQFCLKLLGFHLGDLYSKEQRFAKCQFWGGVLLTAFFNGETKERVWWVGNTWKESNFPCVIYLHIIQFWEL